MGCASTLTGALAVFFLAAFFAAFFTGAVFAADFFAASGVIFTAAAFFAANLFRNAATMLALPAAVSFRFGLTGSGVTGVDEGLESPRIFAHRSCWASFMRLRAAAENFLRPCVDGSGVAAVSVRPPGSIARSSAI